MKYFIFSTSLVLFLPYLLLTQNQTVGVFTYNQDSYEGFTLFSPTKNTYLIDNCGNLVNEWQSEFRSGLAVYLLEDGTLLRTNRISSQVFQGGGIGGALEKLDWEGNVIWSFDYNSDNYHQHHDVEVLPNGNILILAWERKTFEEAIAMGRNPDLLQDNELWPEHIIEIEPVGINSANIVWEWHLWDHLIQDFDSSLPNYGNISDHPERFNINYMGPGQNSAGGKADWIHANSLDYNEELDQIIITSRAISEFWIIDHSTTTEEAASNSGGNAGMGGDILYRWGNPIAYNRGDSIDRVLFGPHHVQWVDEDLPGAGNILIFNNGQGRPDGNFSSVDEIQPPIDGYNYNLNEDNSYGPLNLFWTYSTPNPSDFYADHISGCQRLPNGNTLICSGPQGRFFEVTNFGDVVWEYINPVYSGNLILNQGELPPDDDIFGGIPNSPSNSAFRCERFSADYIGLSNYDLTPGSPIEGPPYIYPDFCNDVSLPEIVETRTLINKIDLLGREMKKSNFLHFEIYNDGTVKKMYLIK